jgi:hypothetical protein
MIIVFVGYYLVSAAPATLPLGQGRVPRRGEGVDESIQFSALTLAPLGVDLRLLFTFGSSN